MRWVAILMFVLLWGCTTTKYVPVESVRTETRDVERWRIDTLIQGDTRFIYVKGDTVIDWRDRWRERIKEVHDTVVVERVDTVREPYPVETVKEVNRLHWWQTALMWTGVAAVIILAIKIKGLWKR